MNIKSIQSKINLLNAQRRQFEDSGLFSPDEIVRLVTPIESELEILGPQLAELQSEMPGPGDLDIVGPEYS